MESVRKFQSTTVVGAIAAGVLALAMALALSLSLGVGQAHAGGGRIMVDKFKGTSYIELGHYDTYNYYAAKGSVKNVKSSDKKVAMAKFKGNYLTVTPKGAGTATISFKYKGKTRKAKLVIYERENPVSSFMVGSRECADFFDDDSLMNANVTGKVTITPAAGWKIKSIQTQKNWKAKAKKAKNGFALKKGMSVSVTLYNKSKKLYSSIHLYSY